MIQDAIPSCVGGQFAEPGTSLTSRDYRRIALPPFLINCFGQKRIGKLLAEKRRRTDRLNKNFRLKRIAAAQNNGRSPPPRRGPASALLRAEAAAGAAAQKPPAQASQPG